MCLPTHKRQPPSHVYGPAPFTEAAEPGSSCPAQPILSPSAPRGGSSFCHTVPEALMPRDKKLLLLLSSVPACPRFPAAWPSPASHPVMSIGMAGSTPLPLVKSSSPAREEDSLVLTSPKEIWPWTVRLGTCQVNG